jgi:Na+/H+ antiporter NhaC
MWIAIAIVLIFIVLFFSFGSNKKMSWHTKENENVKEDPGSGDD